MSDVQQRVFHSMMLMDNTGHKTWAWDAADNDTMLPLIRKMMQQGYVFHIVKRDPLREERLQRVEDIGDNRHVILRSPELKRLVEDSVLFDAEDADDPDEPIETERPARTPEEVASNDTVAHAARRGG